MGERNTMTLPDEQAIEQFRQLYQLEYGIELPKDEAFEMGKRLINLVKAVYGDNLPKVDHELLTNRLKKANN